MKADDRVAFEQLRSVTNMDAVHSIRHYLYFPHEQTAKCVASVLREHAFAVEVRLGADDVNWLVLAMTQAVPSEKTITSMCAHLERITEENGGEYDGWEAEVQNFQ